MSTMTKNVDLKNKKEMKRREAQYSQTETEPEKKTFKVKLKICNCNQVLLPKVSHHCTTTIICLQTHIHTQEGNLKDPFFNSYYTKV